jgi:hypothetical protein
MQERRTTTSVSETVLAPVLAPAVTWLVVHRHHILVAIRDTIPSLLVTPVVCGALIAVAVQSPNAAQVIAVLAVLIIGVNFLIGSVLFHLADTLLADTLLTHTPPTHTPPTDTLPVGAVPATGTSVPSGSPSPVHAAPLDAATPTDGAERTQHKKAAVLGVVPDVADLFVPIDETLIR